MNAVSSNVFRVIRRHLLIAMLAAAACTLLISMVSAAPGDPAGTTPAVSPVDATDAAVTPAPAAVEPAHEPDFFETIFREKIVVLFTVVALGLIIGSIGVGDISLGSSGVLFVALVFGHFNYKIDPMVGTIGLVLFVYGVGISAGPRFFRAFVKQGKALATMGAIIVSIGAVTTVACAYFMEIPFDLAVGIFSGSMTSTPALAAALDLLDDKGQPASIGYGVAYPFGVIGVVLFAQLLPRLLRVNLDEMGQQIAAARGQKKMILRCVVQVINPAVIGRLLVDVHFIQRAGCQVVRVKQGPRMVPVNPELKLEAGQQLLVVGTEDDLAVVTDFLGKRSDEPFFMDAERERKQVIVTSPAVVGRSLRGLDLLRQYGVTVSRIVRNDVSFVPNADTLLEPFDVLTVVGEPENLDKFAVLCGHRTKAFDETDLASLAFGITAGVIIGMMPIGLGEHHSFKLGMAGGPLLIALLIGHFGRLGRISGHVPRAARILMTELGLALFLASAGVKAGESFVTVITEHGSKLFIMGVIVTVIPMIVGYLFATHFQKLNLLETLGGVCGGMTSTPGLGAVTAKTDSDVPVTSYATAYPVALILMTIAAQIIISIMRSF